MPLSKLISIVLLAAILIPAAGGLFIMFKNEIEISQKTTGGYGIPILVGFAIVFAIPLIVFLTSP